MRFAHRILSFAFFHYHYLLLDVMTYIEKLYTAEEIARNLNRSSQTILRWRRSGKIKAVRLPSGRYTFTESELRRILQGDQVRDERGESMTKPKERNVKVFNADYPFLRIFGSNLGRDLSRR